MMLKKRAKAPPEIPTASMADVAFLLIIFFLVTTNFIKEKGLLMELPNPKKDPDKATTEKQNTVLHVAKKRFLLNEEVVPDEELVERLKKILETVSTKAENLQAEEAEGLRVIVLRADNDTPYSRFILAEDAIQQTGELFEDGNNNGKYEPGERFTDENKNERYDPGLVTMIEIEEEGSGKKIRKEEIKSVDMHGEIKKKMEEEEEEEDGPPKDLMEGPLGPQ